MQCKVRSRTTSGPDEFLAPVATSSKLDLLASALNNLLSLLFASCLRVIEALLDPINQGISGSRGSLGLITP